jgi:N-acyl-D-aspartate/D-glutamate deacylase
VLEFWLTEDMVRRSLTHPRQMVLSDGVYRGRPHPRAGGTFPRVLGRYVRELGLLTWEDAVRRMSGWPAQRFGLKQRGQVRVGWAADVTLFDPARVDGPATFAEPTLPPIGIPYVLVNGEFVVDEGNRTPATPGRVLKPHLGEE